MDSPWISGALEVSTTGGEERTNRPGPPGRTQRHGEYISHRGHIRGHWRRLAVVEERNRLARDLHDSVKQQMFALTMLMGSAQLEMDESSEARRILAQAERTATSAQQEMTTLIQALRPVALANSDLGAALRKLCGEWEARHGIVCALEAPGPLAMDGDAEQEIFRVAQEALANIAKHSDATHVDVRAEDDHGALVLRIRDNGHGFDVAEAQGRGLGLSTMRERLARLGGTLQISSSVGGTIVEARAPLSQRTPQTLTTNDSAGATSGR